jgi:hydroxymethylbilane synthase
MGKLIRIGTRESQLAVWQAESVLNLLKEKGHAAELVLIRSEGDLDLTTPLYEIGIQGIFTRTLDIALLANKIDIAIHSMKDVPTQLAIGISQAAVLKRGSYKDLLVYKGALSQESGVGSLESGVGSPDQKTIYSSSSVPTPDSRLLTPDSFTVATSSIRRRAQWLHRYPKHQVVNLRGNVNTRLRKLEESSWQGAIFAAAGLERINLRPEKSIELDWMLPAPAQGAIVVLHREEDEDSWQACQAFNDADTALCTRIERDFLRTLLGGCSTPISALAEIEADELYFRGNILSPDGKHIASIEKILPRGKCANLGREAAAELMENGGQEIIALIRHEEK